MDYSTSKFLNNKKKPNNNFIKSFISKLMICIVLFLGLMIVVKSNPVLSDKVYKFIYENNISFSKFREYYEKYFGGSLPFDQNIVDDTVSVFSEKLKYKEVSDYNKGCKLVVEDSYLVPIIESGIVVYMGEKDGYGYTIIVQQNDGVDCWYTNINSSIKLYDYVEKGSLLGEAKSNDIYLYFQKNGEFISYKDYV